MKARQLVPAVLVVVSVQLLASCADTAEQDLCGQYADLVTSVDELQVLDPLTLKAETMQSSAEGLEAELDQLQAVSEGRLDTAISTLRVSVDALRETTFDGSRAEALEAARPQLTQAMEDIAEAWAVLQQRMDAQCDTA